MEGGGRGDGDHESFSGKGSGGWGSLLAPPPPGALLGAVDGRRERGYAVGLTIGPVRLPFFAATR